MSWRADSTVREVGEPAAISSCPLVWKETTSEKQVHVSLEQNIIKKFLANEWANPTKSKRRLQAQFGVLR